MNERALAHDDPPVSLEDYAFVTAGTSDGLEVLELLEHRELDPSTWPRAETYWLGKLMEDLMQGRGELSLRLGELQAEARASWARRIPPLDEDLGAWVSWSRELSEQAEPERWLSDQGLGPMDLLQLRKLWTKRIAADEALQEEHAELMQQPPESVKVPRPAPLALPKPKTTEVDLDGTGFGRTLSDDELEGSMPFESKAPAPTKEKKFRVAPDLLAPIPEPPPEESSVDATGQLDLAILGASLPFFQPAADTTDDEDHPSEEEPAGTASAPPTPSPAASSPPSPPQSPPAPLPLPVAMPSPVVITSTGSVDHTAVGGVAAVTEDVLPFAGEAPPPSVSGELAPSSDTGSTAFVSVLDLGAVTPFEDKSHDVDSTLPGGVATIGDELPFEGKRSPPPAQMLRPTPGSGTVFVGEAVSPKAALPFVSAMAGDPTLLPGGLTLRQFASLSVEMELSFTRVAELLAAYGLTTDSFRSHNDALRALIARDPGAQSSWDEATATYRRWRKEQP